MGLYIRENEVIDRVRGKVMVVEDPEDKNHLTLRLLKRLVLEAESHVEMDLSPRFAAPLQTMDGEGFDKLPERPTKEFLRTMCELQAVLRVLETDFGRGAVDAEDYIKNTQKRYDAMLAKLMDKREGDEGGNRWKFPPLPSLRLNYMNTEADDGYSGMILTTNDDVPYASNQVNNPAKTWFNVTYEELYGDKSKS